MAFPRNSAVRIATISSGSSIKVFKYDVRTDEKHVFKDVLVDECYQFDFTGDDFVLNLGGHVGAFDVFAFDKVRGMVTLEPSPENYPKLLEHYEMNGIANCEPVKAAVAGHTGITKMAFGAGNGRNTTGVGGIEVKCVSLGNLFERYEFTKIKCDIEGGEYDAFLGVKIPESVREMWFETHRITPEQKNKHDVLINWIAGQGFKVNLYKNEERDLTFLARFKR